MTSPIKHKVYLGLVISDYLFYKPGFTILRV